MYLLPDWTVIVADLMRLWSDCSSCVNISVSPGRCQICRCLLSSQQVHCTDLLFWALSMQAQWYYCAGICPCLLWLSLLWGACQTKFKQTWAGTTNFVLFFIDNKSALYFPDSCQVNPRTVSHQLAPCHSAVGMLLPWFSCLGPDAFKELRFSNLLMMSVHVFLYWCRSREYTKGSQAALL